jgi:branched-chain amino acid transport system substrate-binding protein
MRTRGVALLLLAAIAVASCGNSGDDSASNNNTPGSTQAPGATTTTANLKEKLPVTAPGVTDSEIRVSVIASITNPIGGNYGAIADGVNAYFDMMNSENGGIYGRQFKVAKVRDDTAGNNQAQAQATVSQDNVFATFIAALLFTGADVLAQANIPTFGWNINAEWAGPTNFFPNEGALCLGCSGPGLPWLAKKVGAKKAAVLAYNVPQSASCLDGDIKSFKKFGESSGTQIVFQDKSLQFGQADMSAQVAEMKKRGVQFVMTCMDQNGVFTLAKEMKKQGLDAPQQLPQGYDQNFINANKSYFEGDYVAPRFLAFEQTPQPPEMKKYFEWIGKANKKPGELSMHGWIAASQFVTGLKLAGPDFSQEKVIQALNGVTDFTANGLVAPIDWTKQHADPAKNPEAHGKLDCSNSVIVKDGKFEPVFAQPGKPWVCFNVDDEHPGDETPIALPTPTNYSFAPTGS